MSCTSIIVAFHSLALTVMVAELFMFNSGQRNFTHLAPCAQFCTDRKHSLFYKNTLQIQPRSTSLEKSLYQSVLLFLSSHVDRLLLCPLGLCFLFHFFSITPSPPGLLWHLGREMGKMINNRMVNTDSLRQN